MVSALVSLYRTTHSDRHRGWTCRGLERPDHREAGTELGSRRLTRPCASSCRSTRPAAIRLRVHWPTIRRTRTLPILVQALDLTTPNTTRTVAKALLTIKANPAGAEGLGNLIRLARRIGPAEPISAQRSGRAVDGRTETGGIARASRAISQPGKRSSARRFPTASLSSRADGNRRRGRIICPSS